MRSTPDVVVDRTRIHAGSHLGAIGPLCCGRSHLGTVPLRELAFAGADAYRSFRKAAELDPELAMAHWGMALALGPDPNYGSDPFRNRLAHEAIGRAGELAGRATKRERAYIDALAVRYGDTSSPDFTSLNRRYARAMRRVKRSYPSDLDAATLFAAGLISIDFGEQFTRPYLTPTGGTEEMERTLRSVLRRDPDHVGAIHYLIHVREQAPHPEDALQAARRLKRLAPNAPHQVHMASHIYVHTGAFAAIESINEDIFPLLDEYRERTGEADSFWTIESSHERRFLVETHDQAGRRAEALRERAALADVRERTPAGATLGANSLREILAIREHVLRARIARARGEDSKAILLLRRAVRRQDRLAYDVSYPINPYSFRENLGGALLAAGRPRQAAAVFRADLRRNHGNGRSWFGLMKSLQAAGDHAGAKRARAHFSRAWRLADTELDIEAL